MVGLPMDDSSNNLAEKDNDNNSETNINHILSGGTLGQATIERELQRRVEQLQQELQTAQEDLSRFCHAVKETNDTGTTTTQGESLLAPEIAMTYSDDNAPEIFLPPNKRGYLYRWVDRSIGWSGSKWALRFVTLENGNLAYYGSHTDTAPRYVLSLRGCAVRDEGHKPNKRYKHTDDDDETPPRLDKAGAYFFLFSVYLRDDASPAHQDPTAELTEITPLLRFSTDSYAEKKQWVQLISETCAYCESDAFVAEMERRQEEKQTMTLAMPEAKVGTLPPLYFAPVQQKHSRHPSFTRKPNAAMFRTKSQNLDPSQVESKGYPPSKPMHRCAAPSYLSVEGPTQNYRGFFNLGVIVLVVSNIRLVLSSFKKHGFVLLRHLSEIPRLGDQPWKNFPFVSGLLLLLVFVMMTYLLELGLSRRKVPQRLGMLLHYANAHACMGVSVWIVWYLVDAPAVGAVLLLFATSTWMKLLSYVHTNEDYRSNHLQHQATFSTMVEDLDPREARVRYPQNVTISNIFYFWAAPTLTYQIAFPRSPSVRLWKVAVILIRMVPILALFTFFVSQFVTPTLEGLVADLDANSGQYTFTMLAEYWLRLSIANTYMWLLMFYFYFHLFLNLFAELLRFGDRVFYKDWWNSSEVSAYWRLWNMPVHFWLVRHLYFPCVRLGMSKTLTTFIVFFVSAILHEVLVSVPFHMVRPWSFLGMMMQIPLVGMTKVLSRQYPTLGNVIFWISFCIVGQPMAVLLYTVDYQYAKHNIGAQECVV